MEPELLGSAVAWRDGRLEVVDQTLLPDRLVTLELTGVAEVVDALGRLAVRGAPAIGVAGAFGVVLGLAEAGPPPPGPEGLAAARADLERIAATVAAARPTAANLGWAVRRVVAATAGAADAAELRRLALAEAEAVLAEDREACRRMAEAGPGRRHGRRRAGRLRPGGRQRRHRQQDRHLQPGRPGQGQPRPLLRGRAAVVLRRLGRRRRPDRHRAAPGGRGRPPGRDPPGSRGGGCLEPG